MKKGVVSSHLHLDALRNCIIYRLTQPLKLKRFSISMILLSLKGKSTKVQLCVILNIWRSEKNSKRLDMRLDYHQPNAITFYHGFSRIFCYFPSNCQQICFDYKWSLNFLGWIFIPTRHDSWFHDLQSGWQGKEAFVSCLLVFYSLGFLLTISPPQK